MDDQGYRFGVGVLVVASIIIGVILLLFFQAAPNLLAQRYRVTINFPAAPGVATDTPVRKSGVEIGRVVGVKLLDDAAGVDLVLELDSRYQIRQGELCSIGTASLITGDAVVEIIPPTQESLIARFDGAGGSPRDGQIDEIEQQAASSFLKDEDYVQGGQVALDPMTAFLKMRESFGPTLVAVEKAGVAIEKASNQVDGLAQDVRAVIGGGEGQFSQLARKADLTIENFNQTLDAIEKLFSDQKLASAIDTVATGLPKLVQEAEGMLSQTRSTIASFEGVGKAAEEAMQNVSAFTKPLGDQGEHIVREAMSTLNNLNALLGDLRQLSGKINISQGTIGRLLEDDQLYIDAMLTLANIRQLSQRLQPIVEDVRIFTDKVARDPSQLGVRGAITSRGPGMGVK